MLRKTIAVFGLMTLFYCAVAPPIEAQERGALRVKDIAPGGSDSVPQNLFVFGDQLLFAATDRGNTGLELWKSDGTQDGTVLVKEIFPGLFGGVPQKFTPLGGRVIMVANDGLRGVELWQTGGTEVTTLLVKDIRPGARDSLPEAFTAIGDILVFTADDGTLGRELWSTDGTEDGTELVKDIRPGVRSAELRDLTVLGELVIFSANDGILGRELWKSDGTERGTELIKDIRLGASSGNPEELVQIGGKVFFTAANGILGRELWTTDGTEDGTVLVADIFPGFRGSDAVNLTPFGDRLLFSADDGTNGREPWISDGSEQGTELIKDIRDGRGDSDPVQFVPLDESRFLFVANDGENGEELWVSDGRERGTELLEDIAAGLDDAEILNLTAVGTFALFRADDGRIGRELWKSDGTSRGTVLVRDINTRNNALDKSSEPQGFVLADGAIFFTANDGRNGLEVWRTDGSEDGTVLIEDINPQGDSVPTQLTPLGNRLFFTANDSVTGVELYNKTPNIEIFGTEVVEGNAGQTLAEVQVRLSHPIDGRVVATVRPRSGTAQAGKDFVNSSQRIELAPGEISQTVLMPVVGDLLFEGDEIFEVRLSPPILRAFPSRDRANVTILNDDSLPRLSITDVDIVEGNKGRRLARFRIQITPPSGTPLKVRATTVDGTATVADKDYLRRNRRIKIGKGKTEVFFKVPVRGDLNVEADEFFEVRLSEAENAEIGDDTAVGTIINDDDAP